MGSLYIARERTMEGVKIILLNRLAKHVPQLEAEFQPLLSEYTLRYGGYLRDDFFNTNFTQAAAPQ